MLGQSAMRCFHDGVGWWKAEGSCLVCKLGRAAGWVENGFRTQSNLEKLEEWPAQTGVRMAARLSSAEVGTLSGINARIGDDWPSSCPEDKDLGLGLGHLRRGHT